MKMTLATLTKMKRTGGNCTTVFRNNMLTVLLFVLSNGVDNVECKTQTTHRMRHYKGLKDEPYSNVMKNSLSECMGHCTTAGHCTAITFERHFQLCKLYNTKTSELNMVDQAGSVVVLKTDFAMGSEEFCDASGCPTIECGPIKKVKYATVFGNQVVIGSRLKYVCDTGDKTVTYVVCGTDGKWSDLPTCPGCPDGFDEYNNSCYMVSSVKATWNDAHANCISAGSMLAEVDNDSENEYIRQRTIQKNGYLYIGLTYFTGQWMWATTRTTPVNFYWGTGEPSDPLYEQCALYASYTYENGDWGDVLCNRLQHYICEIGLQ